MYKIAEREGWPKTQSRGKTLWSRSHVDRYFGSQNPKEEISEWYTVAEIQATYGMTLSAIYTLVSKEGIPKKKQGNYVMYSKYHFDLAKGATTPKEPEYYTYPEAMAKYGLTRDQLHHYLKYHNITRVKKGKKINMEFKRNNQLYKNIYNPIYKRFIAASQILIDFLKYPFGDYFCYLF